jgi:site-specific DNA recombinase
MNKLPYEEGDWFAIPVKESGYATGLIARAANNGKILLGYFFGPLRKSPPSIKDVANLKPNEDFPLRGFVACAKCKETYTASWSKGRTAKFPYYRCRGKGCSERNKGIRKEILEKGFEEVLVRIRPKPAVLKLTKAILLDIWNKRLAGWESEREVLRKELAGVEGDSGKLIERIKKASSDRLVAMYEQELEKLSKRQQLLEERIERRKVPAIDFGTALDAVFDVLKTLTAFGSRVI